MSSGVGVLESDDAVLGAAPSSLAAVAARQIERSGGRYGNSGGLRGSRGGIGSHGRRQLQHHAVLDGQMPDDANFMTVRAAKKAAAAYHGRED